MIDNRTKPSSDNSMLLPLTDSQKAKIDALISSMNEEEMAAQTLAWHFNKLSEETLDTGKQMLEKYQLGSIFIGGAPVELVRKVARLGREHSSIPLSITADLVYGAGCRMSGGHIFSHQMAIGATHSEELAEQVGYATAKEGRSLGVTWSFSPVVDLNVNFNNPMMHSRCFGEKPEHVARMARAYIRGMQRDRLMAASAKHFPGDGVDDRDSHVCTCINSLSEQEWMDTFGSVWRQVIDEGVMAVMAGHISLPWIDPGSGYLGAPPGTFSYKIQHDLLRERLGFRGAVVSDAISMIGYSAQMPANDRAPGNLRTGSDLVLYADPERDVPAILDALKTERLSQDRLEDAARKVLELKARVGLLEDDIATPEVTAQDSKSWITLADTLAANSICVVRDETGVLPVKLKPGARVLTVSCQIEGPLRGATQVLDVIDDELRKRGYEVENIFAPKPAELLPKAMAADAVFMNINVPPRYGTTRFFGRTSQTFWDSFWHDHPCVVFTCLCDPYKIYEMPYLPNCINAFSNTPPTQRAIVRMWLGEEPARGKSPIKLDGYFECEV
ncbi:MAG: hypothetical protein GF398_18130 [Chitinivibrionales bacterium]|nr:hypothetical protein [Chitinivibrionales bacterium]